MRVIAKPTGGILGEYVDYARTFDESVAVHGRTLEAVSAAIDSCVERGILRQYLGERRQEVIDMMLKLMDQEEALRVYLAEETAKVRAQASAEGHAEGLAKGHAEGRAEGHAKGRAEGRAEGAIERLAKAVLALEVSSGMSREEAFSALDVEDEERAAVEALLD